MAELKTDKFNGGNGNDARDSNGSQISKELMDEGEEADSSDGKKYITAPIYYVNGAPHIGHLYTSFAVDILAKFEKILTNDVFASFGTDEHGQKIQTAAGDQKPQEYVDEAHLKFKKLLEYAKIDANCFIRTTDDAHKKTATYFWEKLEASGMIYEGAYSGWYSKRDEAYYKEDEVEQSLDKGNAAKETGSPVEFVEEGCLFFRLSAMKEELLKYYEENQDAIKPKSRYAEALQMIKSDLPDLAVSRSRFSWGIPVPSRKGHVMYVWVDALSNYLTSIGYPKNTSYNQWWSNSIHIIGKDILKFHAIYWPAMLIAAGLSPPKRIFAHGWWKVNNEKMSKSVGNVIDPFALIHKYGADSLRYYMFRESTFGNDCSFSTESLIQTNNSELANELGNLVQRILAFCSKRFGSTIQCPFEMIFFSLNDELVSTDEMKYRHRDAPKDTLSPAIVCDFTADKKNPASIEENKAASSEKDIKKSTNKSKTTWRKWLYSFFWDEAEVGATNDKGQASEGKEDYEQMSIAILNEWDDALCDSIQMMQDQQISGYVNRLREAIVKTNRYIDLQAPWKSPDPKNTLGVLCLCIQRLAILGYPIIPTKSKEILQMLGIDQPTIEHWRENAEFPIYNPKPIFEKIEN